MADLRPLHDWAGPPARLTYWHPSTASLASAQNAPLSPVPPSYEQEQHLRAFRACEQRHEEMARLLIVVWEEPGFCDLATMNQVVTAHLRRHDTYHSWFEERGDAIMRHVLTDPATIQMEHTTLGEVSAEAWRHHAMAIPAPFEWDCFRFGILQRAAGFTCFASIDHLHGDASVIPLMMKEIHEAYRASLDGAPPLRLGPAGHYVNYASSQRKRAATMTLADPEVTGWVEFLHRNEGRMPPFPLPLGVLEDRCLAEYVDLDVLDAVGMAAFESACQASGARVIGGLLACAALTERELAGSSRYRVVTPMATRKSPQAFRTAGWCMGVVPIDLDIANHPFPELAGTAQRVFDGRLGMANVPIERVLELAAELPTIRPVATGGVMLSFNDMSRPPLSPHIERVWQKVDGRIYISQGMAAQVSLWFFRTQKGLTLAAAYPANITARASMQRYVEALRNTCRQVADSWMRLQADIGGL